VIKAHKDYQQAQEDLKSIDSARATLKDVAQATSQQIGSPVIEAELKAISAEEKKKELTFGEKLNTEVESITTELGKLAAALQGFNNLSGYAAGGFVKSDTHLARVNPKEFIMNARNSQKFAPQLRAMNMGFAPNSTGSSSNNVNVGDVKITVQGGNANTAREIGEQLRREIRRGILRF